MTIYSYQHLLQFGIYTVIAALLAVAIVAVGLSVWDLFFRRDDFEEMEYLP